MAGTMTRQPLAARAIVTATPAFAATFVPSAGGGRSRLAGSGLCITGH